MRQRRSVIPSFIQFIQNMHPFDHSLFSVQPAPIPSSSLLLLLSSSKRSGMAACPPGAACRRTCGAPGATVGAGMQGGVDGRSSGDPGGVVASGMAAVNGVRNRAEPCGTVRNRGKECEARVKHRHRWQM